MVKRPLLWSLRIAVSMLGATACALLILMWVRSYWIVDFLGAQVTAKHYVVIGSVRGFIQNDVEQTRFPRRISWNYGSYSSDLYTDLPSLFGFHLTRMRSQYSFLIPYWLPLLSVATLTAVPWVRWRFSLRTLFVLTILAAVAFGLLAALSTSFSPQSPSRPTNYPIVGPGDSPATFGLASAFQDGQE